MFSILITFSCGLSDSGKPLSDIAASFAEVFPPPYLPLSLAIQNKDEVFDHGRGKPSLKNLLKINSPPRKSKHHKGVGRAHSVVPLLIFATAA